MAGHRAGWVRDRTEDPSTAMHTVNDVEYQFDDSGSALKRINC